MQVRHLCRVVRGQERPLVAGRDGFEALHVILAAKESAATGRIILLTATPPGATEAAAVGHALLSLGLQRLAVFDTDTG